MYSIVLLRLEQRGILLESMILSAEYAQNTNPKSTHYHDCHQLLYITHGHVRITVSANEYTAGPGTVVLISRFEEHSIQVESASYQRYTLQIAPEAGFSDPLLSLLVNRPESFRHALQLPDDSGVEMLLRRILQEFSGNNPLGGKMMDLLLLQLLITVYRAQPQALPYREDALALIRSIQHQFETEYASECTLQSLSAQHHISQSHLSHLFKEITGTSVMGYLSSCRFAAARRYLAETDLEVGRIVELCGFSDCSNFSRSFKASTGYSPTAYRSKFYHK